VRRLAPVVLCILDGFGIAAPGEGNAVTRARMPNWQRLQAEGLVESVPNRGATVPVAVSVVAGTGDRLRPLARPAVAYRPILYVDDDGKPLEKTLALAGTGSPGVHEKPLHFFLQQIQGAPSAAQLEEMVDQVLEEAR
jgi:hypothetical protein